MRFLNAGAETTLDGAIDASTTTLTINTVGASPSTATPNFRIWIDSEMMIATGIAGDVYTVIRGMEGTTAAAHDDGALILYPLVGVSELVRAAVIFQMIARMGGSASSGTLFNASYLTADDETALLPNSKQLVASTGITFNDTGPTLEISSTGGSGGGSQLDLPPALGTWTQVNYGTSTSDNNNGFIYLETQDPGVSGQPRIRALAQSLPGSTFDLKATFVHLFSPGGDIGSNSAVAAIGLRDSSGGGIIAFSFLVNNSTWYIQINRFSSATVYSSTSKNLEYASWRFTGGAIGFRIRQASGTRYFDWSNDQGLHWKTIYSEGSTDFITPDQALLIADSNTNGLTVGVTLTGWELT